MPHWKSCAAAQKPEVLETFEKHKTDLGYGLLLKKYTPGVVDATPEQKVKAANDTIPKVGAHLLVVPRHGRAGDAVSIHFSCAFYFCARRSITNQRWLLKLALYSIPLPWVAAEFGLDRRRITAVSRGPFPTCCRRFLSSSNIAAEKSISASPGLSFLPLSCWAVELYLMFKYARLGRAACKPATTTSRRYTHDAEF